MYSINTLAVVAIFGLTQSISALPQDVSRSASAAVPADPISKYTVDFFLDNVKTRPEPSSCVFYTSRLSTQAQNFASREVKFTIWGVWDCMYYNRDQADTNPLRDILKGDPDATPLPDAWTYFKNMSEAYAALCSGTATLLTRNPQSVDMSGIWGQVEFVTLQKTGNPGGQVDQVDACDQNGSGCGPFWTRTPKLRRSANITRAAIDEPEPEKRQVAALPNQCYTPEELGTIFADIDTLW